MERNEPTTAEIAKALREADEYSGMPGYCGTVEDIAAHRLEQLERERVRITNELTAMTARAEKAEAERDAAVNALTLYEDALFDECDKSYQSGFMDGFRSREGIDDED